MSEHPQRITDEGSLHSYRTEIPNTVIRGLKSLGLSVHAKWLYVYFKSVCGDTAECYRTTTTIAAESGISRAMVSTAKKELVKQGLIVVQKSNNPYRQADHIRIKNIWLSNMQEFSVLLANTDDESLDESNEGEEQPQRSISERSVLLANTSVLLANQRRSQEEDPLKKNLPPPLTTFEEPPTHAREKAGARKRSASRTTPTHQAEALEVLDYLNTVHGRCLKAVGNIPLRLADGRSVDDCKLMIDWMYAINRLENPTGYEQYFGPTSSFRPGNFDRFFDRACRWDEAGRPDYETQSDTVPLMSQKGMDSVRASHQVMEDIRNERRRNGALLPSA